MVYRSKQPVRPLAALLLLSAFAIPSLLVPQEAPAATATGSIVVSAVVLSVCGVSATPLAFGNYSAVNTSPTDTTATITATCTAGVPYTLSLDAGAGSGATVAARKLTSGGNTLNYQIYTNSNHTTLWGDGTLSTATTGGTAALAPQNYTVYGRIPASQQSAAGVYADLVTVTLTY